MSSDAPTWTEIETDDDDQEGELLDEWRGVQRDPPLESVTVHIPKELCWLGQEPPQ